MIALIRFFCFLIMSIYICIFGIIYCLFNSNKSNHTAIFGRLFGCMAPILGIKLEIRNFCMGNLPKTCVYISNHQNTYDMVTVSYAIQPNTITVGKKQLLWIPFFGQLYWLSGNILIDRFYSVRKARSIMMKIVKIIRVNKISVWIFPEGTRNQGKGLLPFKTGAVYIAMFARVPIVPICVSNISNNKIKLNRWSNGLVIIEILPPIEINQLDVTQVRQVTAYCHKIMQFKINNLDTEVRLREEKFLNNS